MIRTGAVAAANPAPPRLHQALCDIHPSLMVSLRPAGLWRGRKNIVPPQLPLGTENTLYTLDQQGNAS